jgi:hypothetical protein
LATLKSVSFYLPHNVSTLNQCRKLSCGTVVCKHFASYQGCPNYRWDLSRYAKHVDVKTPDAIYEVAIMSVLNTTSSIKCSVRCDKLWIVSLWTKIVWCNTAIHFQIARESCIAGKNPILCRLLNLCSLTFLFVLTTPCCSIFRHRAA